MAYTIAYVCFAFLLSCISAERNLNTRNHAREYLNAIQEQADLDIVDIVTRLTEDLKHLQAKVSTLEQLEARVKELERRLQQQCRGDDIPTRGEVKTNDDKREQRKDDNTYRTQISAVSNTTDGRRRENRVSPGLVAFSAVVSRPLAHLRRWQIIIYDNVILNSGGGYNDTSGVFTAPTVGTYMFLYNLGHYGDGETWVEIMKNGVTLNGIALSGAKYNQNLQGSNSVVTHLDAGDMVWVESYHVPDASVQGDFTTFSGVLLGTS